MKSAKEFAQAATVLAGLAEQCKPEGPIDAYTDSENIIVYHLRSAAAKAREIAEHKASREPQS